MFSFVTKHNKWCSMAAAKPCLFLSGFLRTSPWEMLQPQGMENFCPLDILWRLLQEKEGASLTRVRKRPPVLSAGHSKVGQAREQNVDGRCQRHLRTGSTDLSLQLALIFPLGAGGGPPRQEKATK
jgi:hypothetical protein